MQIPFLPYDKLRPIAGKFLDEYNESGEIPVPIELIIDNRFEIDIVPTPGLHRGYDIDSYITSDFSAIHIDDYVYESRPARYRFSLAHEISHYIIHKDVFAQLEFSNIQGWKDAVQGIPEREYGLLEFQANSLAGLILVPGSELETRFDGAVGTAEAAGIAMDDPSGAAMQSIEGYLAGQFDVSTAVIHRRLEFDKLIAG